MGNYHEPIAAISRKNWGLSKRKAQLKAVGLSMYGGGAAPPVKPCELGSF
jgi:hypothetical protein